MARGPNETRPYEFDLEAFCVFTGQVIAQHFGDQIHARPSFLDEIRNDCDPDFGWQLSICPDAARNANPQGVQMSHAWLLA